MKLAFYKAFQKKPKDETYTKYIKRLWLDWVIAIASFGKYSHVELVDGEDWFSISPRSGEAVKRKIIPKKESWDFINLKLDEEDEARVREQIPRYIGVKYDYVGAIFSITPLCIQKPNRVFCSEVATNILNKTLRYFYLGDGCKYSPSKLYKGIIDE